MIHSLEGSRSKTRQFQLIFQITHPVLASFLFLKWQRIRKFLNINLRFNLLLVFCLTWYICARFGGQTLNQRYINDGTDSFGNSTKPVDFCDDIMVNEWGQREGYWYWFFVAHCVSIFYKSKFIFFVCILIAYR